MTDPLFAFVDIGLVFALALGLAVWQLVVLKRGLRRDREAARLAERERDPS
ncbi:hypothetical protein [Methylobacterium planeticum]|uniref:hypothetical protein n=1 Tax=Methylobacterium planeticum TaxID=2615211 RepID=UPI001786FF87|nr:hypothetical protein [Methylobacterium planeticum]